MQETTLFDTHAAVKRLTEAGMPVSQAEAVVASQAEVMLHSLANKQDIESFRSEITENFASTHKSFDALRAEVADCHRNIALTRKDVENLRSETRKDIATIHKDIEALRAELKTDIEALRADTKKDISIIQKEIAVVRTEAKQDVTLIRKDIEILRAELSRDLADGLHRQNRFMLTALMGFALLIIASIEVRLLA